MWSVFVARRYDTLTLLSGYLFECFYSLVYTLKWPVSPHLSEILGLALEVGCTLHQPHLRAISAAPNLSLIQLLVYVIM